MGERLAILLSGGGTTADKIISAIQSGEIPIEVACVISSNPAAGGLEKARRRGLPEEDLLVLDPQNFPDQTTFGEALLHELQKRNVTVITQNGWMPLTPEVVIASFPDKIFNQHPGSPPDFAGKGMYGRRVHTARLDFVRRTGRDFWTEAIAQKVAAVFDEGAVVKSTRVEIFPEDTVESLQQRVLEVEHQIQIALLKDIVNGTVIEEPQRQSLVREGEKQILLEAKKNARRLYPYG